LDALVPEAASDRVLLGRVGEGDERALAMLYQRYSRIVFAFVLTRTPDHSVAEEVSADVWFGCWRSARAFRGDSQVLTWLLGIARRQIVTHTRGKRLPVTPYDEEAEAVPSDADDPADIVVAAAGIDTILDALDSLPDDLGEVVALAWLHELPYDEISSVVGIPVGTVKSRVSRARRILRETLRRQDV